ncbi:MAG: thiopeptide-type bacteriocin biosynthesis protein [Bacteroidota bacterium]
MQRTFIPGSEWLYFKIYCGTKTADKILTESILPLIEDNDIFNSFFFIRYADPKNHFRIRFKTKNANEVGFIMSAMQVTLQPYIDNQLIWKVQLDTYNREIERYGEETMELTEQLFQIDSLFTLQFLNMIEGEEGEIIRWHYALSAIDKLLNAFNFSIQDKSTLLKSLSEGFGIEFGMDKNLKIQLDKKYRDNTKSIQEFIAQNREKNEEYEPIFDLLNAYEEAIRAISNQIIKKNNTANSEKTINDLLGSYIHMLCNRLFKSKQRMHELVIYDFLYRYYKSEIARNKSLKTQLKTFKNV